jgi:hypothetical protein
MNSQQGGQNFNEQYQSSPGIRNDFRKAEDNFRDLDRPNRNYRSARGRNMSFNQPPGNNFEAQDNQLADER